MNDMILNLLANDSFTVSDFRAVGLSAENTKLESEEKYLQSEMIQENPIFQDDQGNFSEDIFHQYYLQATDFYNKLADETYLENITKNTFYSKDNISNRYLSKNGSKYIYEDTNYDKNIKENKDKKEYLTELYKLSDIKFMKSIDRGCLNEVLVDAFIINKNIFPNIPSVFSIEIICSGLN